MLTDLGRKTMAADAISAVPVTAASPGIADIAARLERLPLSSWHRKLTVLVGIGAFYEYFEVFGGGVLAAVLRSEWKPTTFETASIISSVFIGMFVGALTLGRVADRLGRKRMFLLNLGIYLVFSLLSAASPSLTFLVVCRFLAGIGAGAEAALIPTYLGEFLPRHVRGRYLGYAFSIGVASYPIMALVGAPLARSTVLGLEGWRWLLIIGASGIPLILWMRRAMPESPRWLASRGRMAEAEAELQKIETIVRADTNAPLPPPALAIISRATDGSSIAPLALPRREMYRRMIAMGSLFFFGPLGFYGFASLVPAILISKGFTMTQSLLYTAMIAVGYPLGSFCSALVAETMERRNLVLLATSVTGLLGLVFGVATADWLILAVGFLLAFFGNTHGTSLNMYVAEVFPTRNRSTLIGICYGIGRLAAAMLPFMGLSILAAFGASGVLTASALMMGLACLAVLLFGPRTTGLSLEDAAGAQPA